MYVIIYDLVRCVESSPPIIPCPVECHGYWGAVPLCWPFGPNWEICSGCGTNVSCTTIFQNTACLPPGSLGEHSARKAEEIHQTRHGGNWPSCPRSTFVMRFQTDVIGSTQSSKRWMTRRSRKQLLSRRKLYCFFCGQGKSNGSCQMLNR